MVDINLEELKGILSGAGVHVTLTGATCIHCATVLPTIEAATAHDAECSKHPIVAERDSLRAELAAAKERAEFWEATSHLADKVRSEQFASSMELHDGHVRTINQLRAHVNALRAAMEVVRRRNMTSGHDRGDTETVRICDAALAATPAQSLAKGKAAALRGLYEYRLGVGYGEQSYVMWERIEAEADRQEAAAKNE